MARVIAALAALTLTMAGCSQSAPPDSSSPPRREETEIDLGRVIARVRASFRPSPEGLRSQGAGFEAVAGPEGTISLVGWHAPRGAALLQSAPWTLRTLGSPATSFAVLPDGAVEIDRGFAVERLYSDGEGIEQSWRFASEPGGEEALTVAVEVKGHRLSGRTASGWHWVDPGTGVGFRYGLATWIDARGARTPVEVTATDGALSLRVPREVLARSTYPAVLDPVLVPEFGMDQPVQSTPTFTQFSARVADNGLRLVVWADDRASLFGRPETRLYAARISAARELLDPSGIELARIPSASTPFYEVAASPQGFLVLWNQLGSAATSMDIQSVLIDPSGALVNRRTLDASPGTQNVPTVAWDGTQFLAAWQSHAGPSNGNDLVVLRLDAAGLPVGSPQPLIAVVGDQTYPHAASVGGGHLLLVWVDSRGGTDQIFGTRVLPDGGLLVPGGAELSPSGTWAASPKVAVGTQTLPSLVVWEDYTADGDVLGRQWFADGGLSPGLIPIGTSPGREAAVVGALNPSAGAGGRFMVAWSVDPNLDDFGFQLLARTVDFNESLQAPFEVIPGQTGDAFAHDLLGQSLGSWLFYSHTDNLSGRGPLMLRTLSSIGAGSSTEDAVPVIRAANRQGRPSVASDGKDFLVVWEDHRAFFESGTGLWGARVRGDGTVLDPAGIALSSLPSSAANPTVTHGGGSYLVAWAEEQQLFARRVGGDGGLLESAALELTVTAESIQGVDAVFDGENFVLAWRQFAGSAQELRSTRISPQGGVLPGADTVLMAEPGAGVPVIASGGDGRSLVAWPLGTRLVTRALEQGVPGPLHELVGDGGAQGELDLVAIDGGYLATWEAALSVGQVHLGRLNAAGELEQAGALPRGAGNKQHHPQLAAGGRYPLVSWEESADGGMSVRWGWIAPGGTALVPTVDPETRTIDGAASPAVASAGGKVLLAYERMEDDPAVSNVRIKAVLVQSGRSDGVACSEGNQCESGFCTDGVCCDAVCGGDCQSCLAAQGASADGTCTLLPSATVCRPAEGACDQVEHCSGIDPACPADGVASVGTHCRSSAGDCDLAEACDGAGKACPEDGLRAAGEVCRPATACSPEETCSGSEVTCPTDVVAVDGTVCSEGVCSQGSCSRRQSFYSCATAPGGPALWMACAWALLWSRRRARDLGAGPGELGRRFGAGLVVTGMLFLGGEGIAAEPARAEGPGSATPKLAFIGVAGATGVSPEIATAASEYVQSELVSLGAYRVTGPAEISAMLGIERQRQLLGCTEDSESCLAEIAGALAADRALTGTLSQVGESLLVNLVLVDLKTNAPVHRVGRRLKGGTVDAVLDQVRPMLLELVAADPLVKQKPVAARPSGPLNLVVGVRGESDLLGPSLVPAISASYRWQQFGAAVTVIIARQPGFRAEARYLPWELGLARPYLALGGSVFSSAVAARAALGSSFQVGPVQLSADLAYERFFNTALLQAPDALLLGVGAGWLF